LKRNFAYSEWESYSGWNISKHTKNTITVNLEGNLFIPHLLICILVLEWTNPRKQKVTQREGYYWNEHIRSEVNAYDNFNYDQPKAEELLKAGFV
jgi:hypothetical protein